MINSEQVLRSLSTQFLVKTFYFFLNFFILTLGSIDGKNTYSEYWQEMTWTMWEKGPFQISTYARMESDDHWKEIRSYHLSEQISYQPSKEFSFGLNYRYVHWRNIVANSPWEWQHRVEIEMDHFLPLYDNSSLTTRHRLEIRRIENQAKINYRYRQRIMWVFAVKNSTWIKNFSVYNEIFYNISQQRFNHDRLCPCMLTFMLNRHIDLDVYFIIRFFIHDDIWKKSYVAGSHLRF